ncbi:MAG: hypothetical protein EOO61_03755 [Hymenobacter sp.]|nr:MAG: hypothetical protein EOO61_03755 [Hymenobacter sp.]
MAKQDLIKLAKEIEDTTSKKIREGQLNRQAHTFLVVIDDVADQLAAEISYIDETEKKKRDGNYQDLLTRLKDQDLVKAATIFKESLIKSAELSQFYNKPKQRFTVPVNSDAYRRISTALTKANQSAIDYLTSVAGPNSLNPKTLIQFDHSRAAANVRTAYVFSKALGGGAPLLNKMIKEQVISQEDYDVYTDILSYYKAGNKEIDFSVKVVTGELESGSINVQRGRTVELARRFAVLKSLEKMARTKSWINQKGSDSYREFIEKSLGDAVEKAGGVASKKRAKQEVSSAGIKTKVKAKTQSQKLPGIKGVAKTKFKSSSFSLNLITLLNAKLPEAIRANMGPQSLVNRTGTLSNSARVVNVQPTKQGYPSLGYTYARSPYDVFDSVLGRAPWNIPSRDPKALIEKSIRDIAREMAIGRFYLRRV